MSAQRSSAPNPATTRTARRWCGTRSTPSAGAPSPWPTASTTPSSVHQHSPLMSPLVWDLAHVGNFEEIYLVRSIGALPVCAPTSTGSTTPSSIPRAERVDLPLLWPAEARRYLDEVRDRTMEILDAVMLGDDPQSRGRLPPSRSWPSTRRSTPRRCWRRTSCGKGPRPEAPAPPPSDAAGLAPEVAVPGGPFTMGTSTDPWALDNERPAHAVDVPRFWIDTVPVTNAAYQAFIADGGYDEPRWWTPEGWDYRQREGLEAPLYWYRDRGVWWRRRFGWSEPVPGDEPVVHVCWYEADAYARWAGRRLPTEAEWEKAARYDQRTGITLRNPWGATDVDGSSANVGQLHLQPAPVGSFPASAAPCGARQMLGDVWEWTASDFTAYPGFKALPDETYSEVLFGPEYKVLRGGSFATDPVACRATFRNWDLPIRRQIFAGFRTARDTDDD